MASENEVKKAVEEIEKIAEKVGAWVEEKSRSIRSGKTSQIRLEISFKVTS